MFSENVSVLNSHRTIRLNVYLLSVCDAILSMRQFHLLRMTVCAKHDVLKWFYDDDG